MPSEKNPKQQKNGDDNVQQDARGRNIGQASAPGSSVRIEDHSQHHYYPGRPEHGLYVNVPSLPAHFLGRDGIVAALTQRLTSGETTALSADGLPGVGKTTLAVALARTEVGCWTISATACSGRVWAATRMWPASRRPGRKNSRST